MRHHPHHHDREHGHKHGDEHEGHHGHHGQHHHGHGHHHHHPHDQAGFAPRHGGRHGEHGGGRGGRRGGFGFDDDGGMPRGRKLSSDDLQLLLLALIAEQPSHGYELIKALETRSNGFYVPSPGVMYPALAYMEDQGYVTIQLEGNRKRYALSGEGRAHLDANREHVEHMFARLQEAAQRMELMRNALEGERGGREGWTREFADARNALKHALQARSGASAEDSASPRSWRGRRPRSRAARAARRAERRARPGVCGPQPITGSG
jgi:DNA-binding PadR family transcriptional regulator